ncbi:MAG: hypothetical protein U1F43_23665 [Myxococcota bacterium]
MRHGTDYTGDGTSEAPWTVSERLSYFHFFEAMCAAHALDKQRRHSAALASGDLLDVVPGPGGERYFRVPPSSTYDAPMAWLLRSSAQVVGRVAWRGGTDVAIEAGPSLAERLRADVDAVVESEPIGLGLDLFFATLERRSGGALRAERVPRGEREPAAARPNARPQDPSPAALLDHERRGARSWRRRDSAEPSFIAGGTQPDGRELWISILPARGGITMAQTRGPSETPVVVTQKRGIFSKPPLVQLYALLCQRVG